MAKLYTVEVLEHCRVSPPRGYIPPLTSLPLTIFDLTWLILSQPAECLFFYSYNHTKAHFMNTTLPKLKHSLSLTLQHFFPLSGTLAWPTQATKPHINCSEDNLSVSLTTAESTSLDFSNLVGNHPRDVNEFYPLVAQLSLPPNTQVVDQIPVMALQITLFPNTGICIGISSLHAAADGMAISHFVKSWALVSKSGLGSDDTSCLNESLPFYNRSVINDPNNLETVYLNELASKFSISQKCFYKPKINATVAIDKVRATFVLGRADVQKLKKCVIHRLDEMYNEDKTKTPPPLHISTFVATCAYVWVCLIKVLASEDVNGMERECLLFPADCRERLNPPIPMTYFGNCLMDCVVDVKKDDLIGENGIAIAAVGIKNAIQKTKEGILRGGENFFENVGYVFMKPRFLSIAGSPKLGLYDTDFGWGRPGKVEVASINSTGAISLCECRNEEGALEVGMVLNKLQMDVFTSLLTNTLSVLS